LIDKPADDWDQWFVWKSEDERKKLEDLMKEWFRAINIGIWASRLC